MITGKYCNYSKEYRYKNPNIKNFIKSQKKPRYERNENCMGSILSKIVYLFLHINTSNQYQIICGFILRSNCHW